MLSLAFRFLRAKTPEERAHVDLETHYTKVRNCGCNCCHHLNNIVVKTTFFPCAFVLTCVTKMQEYLDEKLESCTRRAILYKVSDIPMR
jgi:hypothetical protein